MNIPNPGPGYVKNLICTAVATTLLAACATAPQKPDGAAEARNKLTQLQSNPDLATRAPQSIEAADLAVRLAEQPETDKDLGAYRVYMADRKVEIARADAQTRYAEEQRVVISAQRDQARLDARTREADAAKDQAALARAEGAEQKVAADQARAEGAEQKAEADQARAESAEQKIAADQARAEGAGQRAAADQARAEGAEQKIAADQARAEGAGQKAEADQARAESAEQKIAADQARAEDAGQKIAADQARAEGAEQKIAADQARAEGAGQKAAAIQARGEAETARQAALSSNQQVAELQLQVAALQARPTDRGLVLTLGDALFSSGRADLQPGAGGHLQKLIAFLNRYPDRTVVVEGYTDSKGSEDFNQGLSERRAGAVKSYLIDQGISSIRLTSLGKGASNPVAGNDTASGRQQNRRVEVIISEPAAASR